jgi:putative transposase
MKTKHSRKARRDPTRLTYAELRDLNPAAARQKLLEALDQLDSIHAVARLFVTDRNTVRKAVRRFRKLGPAGLTDASRRPLRSPTRTKRALEAAVLAARRRHGYGPLRLHRDAHIPLSPWTIRNILRRHHVKPKRRRSWRGTRRNIFHWEDKAPLSFFQTDLKIIRDRKALPQDVYTHHERAGLPLYQWTAACVRSRLRFLAWSNEKTVANGLLFMTLLVLWLRAHGVHHRLSFQTDWGEEFGGKSPRKLAELDRRLFAPLNATLLKIRKGRTTDNAIVERSHRSDDEEFYAPLLTRYPNTDAFLVAGYRWQSRFNIRRPHFGRHMDGRRPLDLAQGILPDLRRDVALFPPLLLDNIGPLPQLLRDVLPITETKRPGDDVPAHYPPHGRLEAGGRRSRGRGRTGPPLTALPPRSRRRPAA